MRMAMIGTGLASALALSGCQTSGYTTGEVVRMDCKYSPIQTSANNYSPSRGECFRKSSDGSDVSGYFHNRYFDLPGGYANVAFVEAIGYTYLNNIDVVAAASSYNVVKSGAANWRDGHRVTISGITYYMRTFDLGGKSCVGFVAHSGMVPSTPGFMHRIQGYSCAKEMNFALVEKYLATLTFAGLQ